MTEVLTSSNKNSGSFGKTPGESLNDIMREAHNDAARIICELREKAREYGMTRLARETGLSRESLYKSLSGCCSPEFATILKILNALDLDFAVCERSRSSK